MDIKNFRLKSKKNYKKVNFSLFNDENSFYDYVARLLENGTDIIEFEETNISSRQFLSIAKKLRELCSIYEALFFIYDRCDIALLCEADGIVLSDESIELKNAKNILGKEFMYGYFIKNKNLPNEEFDFLVSENSIKYSDLDLPCYIRK